jgi:hypothetical protein
MNGAMDCWKMLAASMGGGAKDEWSDEARAKAAEARKAGHTKSKPGYVRSTHMLQLSEQARAQGNHEQAAHLLRMHKEAKAEERAAATKIKPKAKPFTTHPLGGFKNQSVKNQLAGYKH